jgi:hypothetical protein
MINSQDPLNAYVHLSLYISLFCQAKKVCRSAAKLTLIAFYKLYCPVEKASLSMLSRGHMLNNLMQYQVVRTRRSCSSALLSAAPVYTVQCLHFARCAYP